MADNATTRLESGSCQVPVIGHCASSWTICLLIGSFVPIPVTKVTRAELPTVIKSQSPVKHLPLAWILGQKDRNCTLAGVMARLTELEKREPNLHHKQCIRQAWIILSFLQKGYPDAFVRSSYACFGVHPDKVFPRWLAEQRAKLGPEFYLFYNDEGVLRPDVPKFSPTTAHRANEADSATWDGSVGLVPTKQEVV